MADILETFRREIAKSGITAGNNDELRIDEGLSEDFDLREMELTAVLEFVPTRHELFIVAKYWRTQVLDEFFWRAAADILSDAGRSVFANRRLNRIARVIGDDAFDRAIKEADEEFVRTIGPETWRILTSGTTEEVSAFRDRFNRPSEQRGRADEP